MKMYTARHEMFKIRIYTWTVISAPFRSPRVSVIISLALRVKEQYYARELRNVFLTNMISFQTKCHEKTKCCEVTAYTATASTLILFVKTIIL